MENVTNDLTEENVVEEIQQDMDTDVIGEPDSELESAVEDEEVTQNSGSSLVDMVDMIDDMSKSLEVQRQMFDAREQLSQVCFACGIKKDDQDFLDKKFQDEFTKDELSNILKNEELLDETFFTREDGSVIHLTTLQGTSQYEAKQELVEYLYSFYDMERSVQKDLDEMNADITKFKQEDVASASATVANNLKQGIEERWAEMEAMDDSDPKKKEKRLLLSRLKSSYTFADMIAVLDKYPSVVRNTIKDVDSPERVKETGKRYASKLEQGNVFSKLYGIIQDDISKSIEKQFLHEDDYIAGRENLFGFFLIRFFAMETWTEGSQNEYTKELHNATCIVLNNLVNGTLDTEFRDEVVENIKAVWMRFKEGI